MLLILDFANPLRKARYIAWPVTPHPKSSNLGGHGPRRKCPQSYNLNQHFLLEQIKGLEPSASCVEGRRSTNWAISAGNYNIIALPPIRLFGSVLQSSPNFA